MQHFLRLLAAGALALFSGTVARGEAPSLPLPWTKVSEFFVTPSPARLYGPSNAVYVQTHLPTNYGPQATGVWHAVDLRPWGVASDAHAAFLSGMLVITHGASEEIADLHLVLRRPGDFSVDCSKYIGQVVEAHISGGQRSGMASWVPLQDGQFEFCYQISTPGTWPSNSSYAINLSLQAWVR